MNNTDEYHRIETLKFCLGVPTQISPQDVQNITSKITKYPLTEKIAELFSSISKGANISLDTLELDLGSIPYYKLEQSLPDLVLSALEKKLAYLKTKPNNQATKLIEPESVKIACYLLKYGSIPWWAPHAAKSSLKFWINLAAKEAPEILAQFLVKNTHDNAIRNRFNSHASIDAVEKIVATASAPNSNIKLSTIREIARTHLNEYYLGAISALLDYIKNPPATSYPSQFKNLIKAALEESDQSVIQAALANTFLQNQYSQRFITSLTDLDLELLVKHISTHDADIITSQTKTIIHILRKHYLESPERATSLAHRIWLSSIHHYLTTKAPSTTTIALLYSSSIRKLTATEKFVHSAKTYITQYKNKIPDHTLRQINTWINTSSIDLHEKTPKINTHPSSTTVSNSNKQVNWLLKDLLAFFSIIKNGQHKLDLHFSIDELNNAITEHYSSVTFQHSPPASQLNTIYSSLSLRTQKPVEEILQQLSPLIEQSASDQLRHLHSENINLTSSFKDNDSILKKTPLEIIITNLSPQSIDQTTITQIEHLLTTIKAESLKKILHTNLLSHNIALLPITTIHQILKKVSNHHTDYLPILLNKLIKLKISSPSIAGHSPSKVYETFISVLLTHPALNHLLNQTSHFEQLTNIAASRIGIKNNILQKYINAFIEETIIQHTNLDHPILNKTSLPLPSQQEKKITLPQNLNTIATPISSGMVKLFLSRLKSLTVIPSEQQHLQKLTTKLSKNTKKLSTNNENFSDIFKNAIKNIPTNIVNNIIQQLSTQDNDKKINSLISALRTSISQLKVQLSNPQQLANISSIETQLNSNLPVNSEHPIQHQQKNRNRSAKGKNIPMPELWSEILEKLWTTDPIAAITHLNDIALAGEHAAIHHEAISAEFFRTITDSLCPEISSKLARLIDSLEEFQHQKLLPGVGKEENLHQLLVPTLLTSLCSKNANTHSLISLFHSIISTLATHSSITPKDYLKQMEEQLLKAQTISLSNSTFLLQVFKSKVKRSQFLNHITKSLKSTQYYTNSKRSLFISITIEELIESVIDNPDFLVSPRDLIDLDQGVGSEFEQLQLITATFSVTEPLPDFSKLDNALNLLIKSHSNIPQVIIHLAFKSSDAHHRLKQLPEKTTILIARLSVGKHFRPLRSFLKHIKTHKPDISVKSVWNNILEFTNTSKTQRKSLLQIISHLVKNGHIDESSLTSWHQYPLASHHAGQSQINVTLSRLEAEKTTAQTSYKTLAIARKQLTSKLHTTDYQATIHDIDQLLKLDPNITHLKNLIQDLLDFELALAKKQIIKPNLLNTLATVLQSSKKATKLSHHWIQNILSSNDTLSEDFAKQAWPVLQDISPGLRDSQTFSRLYQAITLSLPGKNIPLPNLPGSPEITFTNPAQSPPPYPQRNLQKERIAPQSMLEKTEQNHGAPPKNEVWRVHNAGIVIFSPYISPLFEKARLSQAGTFLSEKHTEQAVHLLHFLATGKVKPEEYHLTLQKLLCNIPFNKHISTIISPDEDWGNLTEGLIKAVIQHWTTLGNISNESLLSSFVRRDGELRFHEEEGWSLHIDKAPYDMLLQSLPWGISTITLPWMEAPLRVVWV